MFQLSNPQAFWAIACAALVTYGLRLGGLVLAARLPRSGRLRRGMDALPGALLFALVIPSITHEGVWGIIAAALTVLVAIKTRNTILAMLVGMAIIFAQRQF